MLGFVGTHSNTPENQKMQNTEQYDDGAKE